MGNVKELMPFIIGNRFCYNTDRNHDLLLLVEGGNGGGHLSFPDHVIKMIPWILSFHRFNFSDVDEMCHCSSLYQISPAFGMRLCLVERRWPRSVSCSFFIALIVLH